MKKMMNVLAISALITVGFMSCKKSQDLQPQQEDNTSITAKTEAINFSQTLTYADGGDCALLHGLSLPNINNFDYRNTNYNNYPSLTANSWTYGGKQAPLRSLLRFSFTNLNAGCTASSLVSAKLDLHQYVSAGNGAPYSLAHVANDAEIRRVKTSWNPATVTWNTQPQTYPGLPTASRNAVAILPIATPFAGLQDNQSVDVTEIVKKMLSSGQNYGFEIRFPDGRETQVYKARWYGSLAAPNVADRPTLTLYWQ